MTELIGRKHWIKSMQRRIRHSPETRPSNNIIELLRRNIVRDAVTNFDCPSPSRFRKLMESHHWIKSSAFIQSSNFELFRVESVGEFMQ